MTPRRVRERLATCGLGLALVVGSLAPGSISVAVAAGDPAAAPAPARAPRAPTIYHKSRSFRIPFNVDKDDRPRLREVQLWVSDDSGFTWKPVSRTDPDHPAFTFRAQRDAEYWFAVRTLDNAGKLYPGEDEAVEPSMKVVVDTTPPSLILEPNGRRGSGVSVRWEVRDEHLDLNSLVLEYQAEGARDWREVRIRRKSLLGGETWDAGTAEPLKVRASIADKAGNKIEEMLTIREGTAPKPELSANDSTDFAKPPPSYSPISSGQSFPSPPEELPQGSAEPPDAFTRPPANPPGATDQGGGETDSFTGAGAGGANPPDRGAAAEGAQTLLVPSPQFAMRYQVEDAGPNGPATVELWLTRDSGQNWLRLGEDPDKASPFQVNLGGEGTFGLCLVARAASGLGDQPPTPGEPPQTWVEVDSTPPQVSIDPPRLMNGADLGKIAINWRAYDLHLAPKPVSIFWRADQDGATWQLIVSRMNNTGNFVWTVPPNIPPRFHIRVDVLDLVGNHGFAETDQGSPVIVDRARPKSRILGLEPSARSARSAAPVAGSGTVIPR